MSEYVLTHTRNVWIEYLCILYRSVHVHQINNFVKDNFFIFVYYHKYARKYPLCHFTWISYCEKMLIPRKVSMRQWDS